MLWEAHRWWGKPEPVSADVVHLQPFIDCNFFCYSSATDVSTFHCVSNVLNAFILTSGITQEKLNIAVISLALKGKKKNYSHQLFKMWYAEGGTWCCGIIYSVYEYFYKDLQMTPLNKSLKGCFFKVSHLQQLDDVMRTLTLIIFHDCC